VRVLGDLQGRIEREDGGRRGEQRRCQEQAWHKASLTLAFQVTHGESLAAWGTQQRIAKGALSDMSSSPVDACRQALWW
jgi:hypothetical protein